MRTKRWITVLAVVAVMGLLGLAGRQVAAAMPGDVNDDGFVGGDDLSTVLTNWGMPGATWPDGDVEPYASGDGFVGGGDYSEVLTYWGTPEPATVGVLTLGGLGLVIRRRRK